MRLFVGFAIDNGVKDKIYSTQKSFGNNLAKVAWVPKKNLHCTLKFIGDVDEKKVEEIQKALRHVEFDSFYLNVGSLGVFPSWNSIKVVWLRLLPEKNVVLLQQLVDGELLPLLSNDQQFSPHLTLGRVKLVKKKNEFIDKLKEIKVEGRFKVDSFGLYKSELSKDGSNYYLLEGYKSFDKN